MSPWLPILVGATLSFASATDPVFRTSEDRHGTDRSEIDFVFTEVGCISGYKDYLAGKECGGVLTMAFQCGQSDRIIPLVSDKIDQHLLQYLPEIEFDADTIVALERLDMDKGDLLEDGLEKTVFIGGFIGVGITVTLLDDEDDDGRHVRVVGVHVGGGGGTAMKPKNEVVEAFNSPSRGDVSALKAKLKPTRVSSINADHLTSAFRRLQGHDGEKTSTHNGTLVGKFGAEDVEKSSQCEIGVKGNMTVEECVGNMKMNFAMAVKNDNLVRSITNQLEGHVKEYLPKIRFDDDLARAFAELDDHLERQGKGGELDDFNFRVEIQGAWEASFGCKVALSKKRGRFSKSAECGGKGSGLVGISPPDTETEELKSW